MSKFNPTTNGTMKTNNLAGGVGYKLNEKQKLVTQVLTSFFNEKKFYGDNSAEIQATVRSVISTDPQFVANLAAIARNEFNMRSISHVLVAELANHPRGKKYVRATMKTVSVRPDDMTETLAYYLTNFKKPLPNSLKKGLADAFKTFDEYQLSKYDRSGAVKLKDIIKLVRPKPSTPEQAKLFKKVLEGELDVPYTWETELSKRGNNTTVWEELIASKKVGYMAMLRNLRNVVQAQVSNLNDVISYISNPTAVKHSRQMPYRFFAAYRELEGLPYSTSALLDAIEDAIAISASNLPQLDGNTLLISDNSGSMGTKLSDKSKITYQDVGCLMMAVAQKFCKNATTSVFGQKFQIVNVPSRNGIISNMQTFKNTNVGHSTDLWTAFEWLLQSGHKFDRIIVFSDMQAYDSGGYSYRHTRSVQNYVEEYRKKVNPNVFIHSIDLAGYGTSQFIGNKVNLIGGWNDKVLQFIPMFEAGVDNMLKYIDRYHLMIKTEETIKE